MTTSWFSVQMYLRGTSDRIFSGFFSTNSSTNVVLSFYNITNPRVNILDSPRGTFYYEIGWPSFDTIIVKSFPYYPGGSYYDLNGNSSPPTTTDGDVLVRDSGGTVIDVILVTYDIRAISGPLICFHGDTKILTDTGYRPISDLRAGDLVQTLYSGLKPIALIGCRPIKHTPNQDRVKDQLYECLPENYPKLTERLVLTGCHSLLVRGFMPGEREKTKEILGKIYVTDKHYRLPVCADARARVFPEEGNYVVYHIALEHEDQFMNYGIYANGLLVETTSKRFLQDMASMTLI